MTRAKASSSGGKRPPVRYSGRWFVGGHGALTAALRREKARDGNEVQDGAGSPTGVYIGPRPRDSFPPSAPFIPDLKTLDW
jgi:hypothetical protein